MANLCFQVCNISIYELHFNLIEYLVSFSTSLYLPRYHLTDLPLVPHIYVSVSGQHWFRYWLVAYSAPSHCLNQCSVVVNLTLRNKIQWHFNQNTKFFIHVNAPEIYAKWRPVFHLAVQAGCIKWYTPRKNESQNARAKLWIMLQSIDMYYDYCGVVQSTE